MTPSRPRLSIQGLKAHPSHQRPDMFTAHRGAFLSQQISEHARASKRPPHMQAIDLRHESLITLRNRLEPVIDAASIHPQDFYLFGHREFMGAVNHRFALSTPALVSAVSKKSFSNVNAPILACNVLTSTGSWVDSLPSNRAVAHYKTKVFHWVM
jgi:hypothetical protein